MLTLTKEQRSKVDEYGELERQIAQTRPTEAKAKALKEEILGWIQNEPAGEPLLLEGDRYELQIGAKAKQRTITDMLKLFVVLGKAKFLQLCTFPLSAIEKHVPEGSHKGFLIEERTGARKITPVALVTAARPAQKRAA